CARAFGWTYRVFDYW
nr:immunoglobulin heavy chain junction region [Macaca mulatta]